MNVKGFLGTNASLLADISLVVGGLVALMLTIGVALAIKKRYVAHRWVQTAAVALNVAQVLVIMIASFWQSARPGIPARLYDTFFLSATLHAGFGLWTLLFGVVVALRGNELVPRQLKFNNYRLFMRAAYGCYMLATVLGVWVYIAWYATPERAAASVAQPIAQRPNEVLIPMADFVFNPTTVLVPVGATVVWTNQDNAPHTATSDAALFGSGLLANGQSFRYTFTQPGEVAYFCELHGSAGGIGMAGTIKVVPPEQAPAVLAAPPRVTPTSAPTPPPFPMQYFVQPVGVAAFRDANTRSDQIVIDLQAQPAPAGQALTAFLMTRDGRTILPLGALRQDGKRARLTYTAPDGAPLAGRFERLVITLEPRESTATIPADLTISTGELPQQAFVQVARLFANDDKPGYAVGLRVQADELLRHTRLIIDAQTARDVSGIQRHAEHVYNLIAGSRDPQFGDLDGDGVAQNPGDEFGLLPNGDQSGYIAATLDTALAAQRAPDATAAIKAHARHINISVENMQGWTTEARDLARQLARTGDVEAARIPAARLQLLAEWISRGNDANGDGEIAPVFNEGGGRVAYEHAQFMAGFGLVPASAGQAQP